MSAPEYVAEANPRHGWLTVTRTDGHQVALVSHSAKDLDVTKLDAALDAAGYVRMFARWTWTGEVYRASTVLPHRKPKPATAATKES